MPGSSCRGSAGPTVVLVNKDCKKQPLIEAVPVLFCGSGSAASRPTALGASCTAAFSSTCCDASRAGGNLLSARMSVRSVLSGVGLPPTLLSCAPPAPGLPLLGRRTSPVLTAASHANVRRRPVHVLPYCLRIQLPASQYRNPIVHRTASQRRGLACSISWPFCGFCAISLGVLARVHG